jgi:hypothetical protein
MAKAKMRSSTRTPHSTVESSLGRTGRRTLLKLDEYELMCRIIEAITGEQRPSGRSPSDLLENMIDDDTREVGTKITRAATLYFLEVLSVAEGATGMLH